MCQSLCLTPQQAQPLGETAKCEVWLGGTLTRATPGTTGLTSHEVSIHDPRSPPLKAPSRDEALT